MGDESSGWSDYPWITVEHLPPEDRPKRKLKKKKKKDLNKGEFPTAYQIRIAEDGTKWHSIIDILRPHSPPVEWPEYPDRPVEDDFPKEFSWENDVSDIDIDNFDLVDEFKKLGIPESVIRASKRDTKKTRKLEKKIKKIEEKLRKAEMEGNTQDPQPVDCTGCSGAGGVAGFVPEIPELMDYDPQDSFKDNEYEPMQPYSTTNYGRVADKVEDVDDYYPRDSISDLGQGKRGPGSTNSPPLRGSQPNRDVQYDFTLDSED